VKKRTSPPSAPVSSQQAFHFVDGTSSSKEKRAHVMRHHLIEKGKIKKQRGTLANKRGQTTRYLPWTKKSKSAPESQKLIESDGPGLSPVFGPCLFSSYSISSLSFYLTPFSPEIGHR
jgi:hypothetical protein